jgi:hypothetical protein
VADLICIVHRDDVYGKHPSTLFTNHRGTRPEMFAAHFETQTVKGWSTPARSSLNTRQECLPTTIARLFALRRAEVTDDHRLLWFAYYYDWDPCSRTVEFSTANIKALHWMRYWVRPTQLHPQKPSSYDHFNLILSSFPQSFKGYSQGGLNIRIMQSFLIFHPSYTPRQTSPLGL